MPTRDLMTWIPAQKRWCKRYRGRRYYVSARQLGCAETKEASIHAANEWWRNKQAELDIAYRASLTPPRTLSPAEQTAAALDGDGTSLDHQEQMVALIGRVTAAMQAGFPGWQPRSAPPDPASQADLLRQSGVLDSWQRAALKDLMCALIDGEPIPERLTERLPPARVSQIESAVKGIRGESATQPDRTVQALAEAWASTHRAHVTIGSATPKRYDCVRRAAGYFSAFVGETADVTSVNAEQLQSFYHYCLSKLADGQWSVSYAKSLFKDTRQFIRWLWEQELIDLPRNLDSQNWRFGTTAKPIQTWTPEEVRFVLGKAKGKLKLALLLMVNCAMTQKDVSDLRDDEVDWREGRITRKRSKTRGRGDVPTVSYPLWPSTFALLKRHRSGQETVLLTQSGLPYVRSKIVDGRYVGSDAIDWIYKRLRPKLDGFRKPVKLLRKTSASLLEGHPIYGRLSALFLGHAPATIKDKHYAAAPQALLDEAVKWLGEQLGVAELPAD